MTETPTFARGPPIQTRAREEQEEPNPVGSRATEERDLSEIHKARESRELRLKGDTRLWQGSVTSRAISSVQPSGTKMIGRIERTHN